MRFAEAIAWLDARAGTRVVVDVSGGPELGGNSGAQLEGVLGRGDRPRGTIDSRGGEMHCFAVGGDAAIFLLEGDFAGAEEEEGVLLMDLREVQVNVSPAQPDVRAS